MSKYQIYLAGPDVFLPNASEVLENKKQLCNQYGFEGLSPFDNEIDGENLHKHDKAFEIKEANKRLIGQAAIVIANLNDFRGALPDDGTSFEVGYAEALEKLVYGYAENSDKSLIERYSIRTGRPLSSTDKEGNTLEDFDKPVNLMLSAGIPIRETFEQCLDELRRYLLDKAVSPADLRERFRINRGN